MYRPEAVKFALVMLPRFTEAAEFPKAALHAFDHDPDDERPCTDAPRMGNARALPVGPANLIGMKVDLERAMKAGHQTPQQISDFLCPFAKEDAA